MQGTPTFREPVHVKDGSNVLTRVEERHLVESAAWKDAADNAAPECALAPACVDDVDVLEQAWKVVAADAEDGWKQFYFLWRRVSTKKEGTNGVTGPLWSSSSSSSHNTRSKGVPVAFGDTRMDALVSDAANAANAADAIFLFPCTHHVAITGSASVHDEHGTLGARPPPLVDPVVSQRTPCQLQSRPRPLFQLGQAATAVTRDVADRQDCDRVAQPVGEPG